jgi:flagellar biosynthesis/type III secretory pathway protein FliH
MASILKPKSLLSRLSGSTPSAPTLPATTSPTTSSAATTGVTPIGDTPSGAASSPHDINGNTTTATSTATTTTQAIPAISNATAINNSGAMTNAAPNAILDGVRQQARAILEQCQQECEAIRETTKQQAIEEGQAIIDQLARQQAEQIAEERITQVLSRVDTLCEGLEQATEEWLRNWQHETVSLAIKIAEKLLVRQIESDPTILLTWIEDMVKLVQGQRRMVIKLSSHDAMQLSGALSELIERLSPGVEFQVIEDASFSSGSVVLETPETTLDRSLKTQLERLQQELA